MSVRYTIHCCTCRAGSYSGWPVAVIILLIVALQLSIDGQSGPQYGFGYADLPLRLLLAVTMQIIIRLSVAEKAIIDSAADNPSTWAGEVLLKAAKRQNNI